MKIENENKIDQYFADHFNNFKENPHPELWDKIDLEMQLQQFDQDIKEELSAFEEVPPTHIWQAVEPKLPLNLFVRNQLNWLSKIAAILVIGMLFTMYYHQDSKGSMTLSQNNMLNNPELSTSTPLVQETEFVFEISEEFEVEEVASNVLSEEEEQLIEAEDFLANLLDDDDEFSIQLENDKIQEVLKPIEQLPIENITAILNDKVPTPSIREEPVELQIQIPLIVVEEDEVENLIELYDENEAKKLNR